MLQIVALAPRQPVKETANTLRLHQPQHTVHCTCVCACACVCVGKCWTVLLLVLSSAEHVPAPLASCGQRLWQSTHEASLSLCDFFVPPLPPMPPLVASCKLQPRGKLVESAKFCSVSSVCLWFMIFMLFLISCNSSKWTANIDEFYNQNCHLSNLYS